MHDTAPVTPGVPAGSSTRLLVDGGNWGSGGYLRYLRGVFGSPPPPDFDVVLLCSPQIAEALGPLDPAVRVLAEPALWAPDRHTRRAWWRHRYPELVRQVRPDVVFHPGGLVRGDSGGVPTVAVHHNMAPFARLTFTRYGPSRDSLRFAVLWARLARSFRRADGVIFLAEYPRRAVSRQVRGIRRTAVVANAVPDAFHGAPARTYDRLSAPINVLCVSTVYLFKQLDVVVDAVADLQAAGLDVRLTIIGGGEPRARRRLLSRIRERGAEAFATLVEQVPHQELHQWYASADLFVFPSAAEAWPITLGEAMACGLPIACSDRMAMPDILRDAGVYFNPERPAEIAAALRRLLEDGQRRLECGKRAQEYAADYTWERSRAEIFGFLREVGATVRR